MLQLQTTKSRLLLYSVLLIAVRHKTQELADQLAPKLFHEVRRLLQQAMLAADQPIEFFQAVVILSLWSSTIGQRPLSIDSWLLTSHAFVQATSSPAIAHILQPSYQRATSRECDLDVIYIWNHLCVAHLQSVDHSAMSSSVNLTVADIALYYSGSHSSTRPRSISVFGWQKAIMSQTTRLEWLRRCSYTGSFIRSPAKVKRLWKTPMMHYRVGSNGGLHCSVSYTEHLSTLALSHTDRSDQQRSQFLQMGFYFGQLLASHQTLCNASISPKSSILAEMVHLCKTIINLAIETADERTRHLTDHIYHILTFSALTLTQILHTYESNLQAAGHDIAALDELVIKLANWLKSIGLRCHISHMFSQTLIMKVKKLRNCSISDGIIGDAALKGSELAAASGQGECHSDITFSFPDFIDSELLSMVTNTDGWPQWDSN